MRLRYDISRIDNAKTENIFICNITILEENLNRVYTKNMQNKNTVHHTKPIECFCACAGYHVVLVKSETK